LEQGLNLKLPGGGTYDSTQLQPKDIRTIDVSPQGSYVMGGKVLNLDTITRTLLDDRRRNPRLLVYIRADENGPYKHVAAVLNRLELSGFDQVSLRTSPRTK
jgi:biopolymer transport protein ExbD